MLMCVPSLYNDLQMVFQFQIFQNVPKPVQCDSHEQTRSDAKDYAEDPQSCEGDYASSTLIFKLEAEYMVGFTFLAVLYFFPCAHDFSAIWCQVDEPKLDGDQNDMYAFYRSKYI